MERGAGAQGGSLRDLESPDAGKGRASGGKMMLTGEQVSRHRGIPSAPARVSDGLFLTLTPTHPPGFFPLSHPALDRSHVVHSEGP